jgi:lipopolysaccharide transport system permease protein
MSIEKEIATKRTDWEWEIKPETSWFGISFKEVYAYKDLLSGLTRKEFLGLYHQTLLGPFWALLQPLLTVLTFVLVFNTVIGISTGGVPPFLYNLIGVTLWTLFSEVFLNVSKTFTQNAQVFSKVYFPRIIVALSNLWLQFILYGIQLILLAVVFLCYLVWGQIHVNPINMLLILPATIITAGIAFGGGLIFSVLTAKYRDLLAIVQLIVRLLMFLCPIFYSLAMVPKKVKWLVELNPLSAQFEVFRFAFTGKGGVTEMQFLYSLVFMVVLVIGGVLLFNKMSDKLMDVI